MKKILWSVFEVAETIVIAVVAVFIVRSFVAQPFLVSGASMVPTFSDGNYLLIDELTYHFREPARGEVIVFRYPDPDPNKPVTFFIKRVIGLPGDRVEVKNGEVEIVNTANPNGFMLHESYLPAGLPTSGTTDVTVPAGNYFVMGDNRPYSFDSRSWGFLDKKDIVGLVRVRLWPPGALTLFPTPQYSN